MRLELYLRQEIGIYHLIIAILKKKTLVPMSAKVLQDELTFQRLNEGIFLPISSWRSPLMLFIREVRQQERSFWRDLLVSKIAKLKNLLKQQINFTIDWNDEKKLIYFSRNPYCRNSFLNAGGDYYEKLYNNFSSKF